MYIIYIYIYTYYETFYKSNLSRLGLEIGTTICLSRGKFFRRCRDNVVDGVNDTYSLVRSLVWSGRSLRQHYLTLCEAEIKEMFGSQYTIFFLSNSMKQNRAKLTFLYGHILEVFPHQFPLPYYAVRNSPPFPGSPARAMTLPARDPPQ